mmetsp:Transcript_21645/g.30558  ORF Transcript_21645/g.30558 Transcript_21645/m.30558 type:complete len:335 (-) Transcript_21645:80-1084(-)
MAVSRFATQKKAGKICLLAFFLLFLVFLESGIVDEYLASFILSQEGEHYALTQDVEAGDTIRQGEILTEDNVGEAEGFQGNLRAANGMKSETNEDLQILDNDINENINAEATQQQNQEGENLIVQKQDVAEGAIEVNPNVVDSESTNSNQVESETAGNVDVAQPTEDRSGQLDPQNAESIQIENREVGNEGSELREEKAMENLKSGAETDENKNNTDNPVDQAQAATQEEKEPIVIEQKEKEPIVTEATEQKEKEQIAIEQKEKEKVVDKKKAKKTEGKDEKKKKQTKSENKEETTLMIDEVADSKENRNVQGDVEISVERKEEETMQDKDSNR